MLYVLRDSQGQISSVHREPLPGAEVLDSAAPELREFWSATGFPALDAGFIRVLEDLVDVLLTRQLINITDLPVEAQHKLFERKHFREQFQRQALRLFDDEAPMADRAEVPLPLLLLDRL
ncbi:MAG: hypothetical protein RLY71_3742 [Pseudomonadota bacterium]|jgi:hypothetical protein